MLATEQFFTKPGIAEKLLRDPGAQLRFVVPVVVFEAPHNKDARNLDLAAAVALENYRDKYGDTALKDFLRGYLGCVLY